jgi:LysR family transcriptional regulator, hca operon transcriptional activator
MFLKQLNCFVNLAETLNYSRTAQLLYITQPGVTHEINTLEDELGLKLFIRTKRKVELTTAGFSLYKDMKDILTRVNIAVAKAKQYSCDYESNISIGYDGNTEVKHLPDILKTFTKDFPNVHLYLKTADSMEKRTLFSNYNLDIIFTVKELIENIPQTDYMELFTAEFVCVVPKNHSLAAKAIIRNPDLANESLIFLDPLRCPAEMGRIQRDLQEQCPVSGLYFSDSAQISYTMIKGQLGIAVMPDFVCPEDAGLVRIPFETHESLSYGIAWHRNGIRKEICGFLEAAKKQYQVN